MKLLRLVTAYFGPGLDGWNYWVSKIGRVTVRARLVNRTDIPQEQQTNRARLLTAEIDLPSIPKPDADGLIDIPQQERQICEYAIEAVANLVSVMTRSPRKLSSPWPPVALIPNGEEEWKALEGARAFRYRSGSSLNAVPPALEPEPKLMAGLTDRLDGVQSVATFNSQIQPLARYREAVRFFEMAFARPITTIEKKLAQFLASGKFGYTRDEVAEWISHRHGAMHADEKPSNELVWDADVAQFMDRIDQALYDVLLNKKEWHDPSQERRDLWHPLAGTSDDKAGVFLTQGRGGVRLEFQIFDGFKAYPHDMTASFKKIPPEWWCKFPDDSSSEALVSGDFEIISPPPANTTDSASVPRPEDPHR